MGKHKNDKNMHKNSGLSKVANLTRKVSSRLTSKAKKAKSRQKREAVSHATESNSITKDSDSTSSLSTNYHIDPFSEPPRLSANLILRIDADDGTEKAARSLAGVIMPLDKESAENRVLDQNAFQDLNIEDLSTVYVFGHSNRYVYGKKSITDLVGAFVDAFNHQFPQAHDKLKLNHLCLLGCEVGLIDKNTGQSIAQKIANLLFDHGFVALKVHSIAYELQAHERMTVTIQENAGFAGKMQGRKTGDVYASYHSEGSVAYPKVININSDATLELAKPQNTFVQNENPVLRKQRLATHEAALNAARERFLKVIRARKDRKINGDAHEQTIALKLDGLIFDIDKENSPVKWPQLISKWIDSIDRIKGVFSHSTTCLLLRNMMHGNIELTEKFIDGKASKNDLVKSLKSISREYREQLDHQGESELKSRLGLSSKTSTLSDASLLSENASSSEGSDLESRVTSEQRRNAVKGTQFTKFKKRIHELQTSLREENDELSSTCFGLFNSWEITTKEAKYAALGQLTTANNLTELQLKAGDYLLEEKNESGFLHWVAMLFGSWNNNHRVNHGEVSRTRLLLNEIQSFEVGQSLRM